MNDKLRQKKLAKHKKERKHSNKVYDHRLKCDKGHIYHEARENRYVDQFEKLKKGFGL
jgi:hypothetical protein